VGSIASLRGRASRGGGAGGVRVGVTAAAGSVEALRADIRGSLVEASPPLRIARHTTWTCVL
jgi:hypothetical protein